VPPRREKSDASIEISLVDAEEITSAHHAPRAPAERTVSERDTLPPVMIPSAPRMPTFASNVVALPLPPRPQEVTFTPAHQNQQAPALSPAVASVAVRSAELEADRAMLRAEAMLLVREAVARVEAAKAAKPPVDPGAGLRWLVTGVVTGIFGAYLAFSMATRAPHVDANEVAKAVVAQQAQQQAQAQAAAPKPAPVAVAQAPAPVAKPAATPAPLPVIPSMDVETLPKHAAPRPMAWRPRPAARPKAPAAPAATVADAPTDSASADDALGPVLASK
jgi:hypothetical protein